MRTNHENPLANCQGRQMRFAVDTGGTFTDLVIEDDSGRLEIYKSATTPSDPVNGILNVFEVAAEQRGLDRRELLGGASVLIHGTTRGLNAVLTGSTARTAFLTTQGHPDILLFREGGRTDIFDLSRPYPEPYVPRALTFEVPERVGPDGSVLRPLDEEAVLQTIERLSQLEVEAVGVCLLWSIVNPVHERRVAELLREQLPGVALTLSHELNPCLREYRRASSTCIDASLKPLMTDYIRTVEGRLWDAGFGGRVLIVTSAGAALDARDVAQAPIHSLNSGPSMAPVAGRYFAATDAAAQMAIVADTGGTSYDVSVVRRGLIPWTRETWIGHPYFGHMTGLPSVDVRSVGAGGGSIARVDSGGLLHVGPDSAGAEPGPVCYGIGGAQPTLTDACVVLGYVDPDYFLGGRTRLDLPQAREAIRAKIGEPLGLDVHEAAAAIVRVATERMVSAIEDITIHQGIDPRQAVLVGGGGAAGFNAVAIGRQLGCPEVIIPATGPALSAAGALISDLARSFELTFHTTDAEFDYHGVNGVLAELEARGREFIAGPGAGAISSSIQFSVEARYPHQVWELECPLRSAPVVDRADLDQLRQDFHAVHRDVFSIADEASSIEFESWHVRATCRLREPVQLTADTRPADQRRRDVYLGAGGLTSVAVWRLDAIPIDQPLAGPAVVETSTTTVLVDDGARFTRRSTGSLHVVPRAHTGAQAEGGGAWTASEWRS
jgi:N-methylhydantoinase A